MKKKMLHCLALAAVLCIPALSAMTSVVGPTTEAVQKLVAGASTKQQVIELLGKPTQTLDGNWEYELAGFERVSVSFDAGSNTIASLTLSIRKGDAEQDLKKALARFPNAEWKVETTNWINPHAYPDECYFVDRKLGVSIEYRRLRKEVSSIFRWNPSRQLAAADEGPPPKFCIDGKCFDAILASEWVKNWVPCEIPK